MSIIFTTHHSSLSHHGNCFAGTNLNAFPASLAVWVDVVRIAGVLPLYSSGRAYPFGRASRRPVTFGWIYNCSLIWHFCSLPVGLSIYPRLITKYPHGVWWLYFNPEWKACQEASSGLCGIYRPMFRIIEKPQHQMQGFLIVKRALSFATSHLTPIFHAQYTHLPQQRR